MEVTIEVDFDSRRYGELIDKGIYNANQELNPILTQYAQNNHRYENQTGTLTKSTVVRDVRNGLQLYAKVNYAQYVHEGHGTWLPDPWLEDTIKDNEQLIIDTYEKYISEELRRM